MTTATAPAAAPETARRTRSRLQLRGLLWRRVAGWWPLILLVLAVCLNPTPLGVGVWSTSDEGRTVTVTYGYRGDDLIYVVAESEPGTPHTAVHGSGSSRRLALYPGGPENCLSKTGGLYLRQDSERFELLPLQLSLNTLLEKLNSHSRGKDILEFLRRSAP
ncbi:hypothetical protein [Prosthecobacter vanneervenii]|uniref:Uncharacterized protein n=1 Tax=Prosthecobacter vanneervenii TaxID=48466 RepID=A0A7W8DIY2_9BACT|nr:hypothetical protein [Prosthecobacter vanneervenii]MBB5031445.1 hypothetical protein [Prosthecobacter vanneervenii]